MENILEKYKHNINRLVKAVRIYPAGYKHEDAFKTKIWRVLIKVSINNKPYYKEFKSVEQYGMRIHLNTIEEYQEKVKIVELIRDSVIYKLKTDPKMVVIVLYGKDGALEKYPFLFQSNKKDYPKLKDAFLATCENIQNSRLSKSRKDQLRQFKNRFLSYVDGNILVSKLTKRQCVQYLNDNYSQKSEKTYNHEKEYLSTYINSFVDLEYLKHNFMSSVKNKKVTPKKNEPFDLVTLNKVWELLKEHPVLEFYCMHIYYGLLRLEETNRLRCKDINLVSKYIDVDARKTEKYKKVFHSKLKKVYKELDLSNPQHVIFGRKVLVEDWSSPEGARRRYYSNWFKKVVKDVLKLPVEQGINSLRHNGHYTFYMNKRTELEKKGDSNAHVNACKAIMAYANKKTVSQVETYLRQVDPELGFNYGKYIN